MSDLQSYEPCELCNGWVNTHHEHATATYNGRHVYYHRDYCIEAVLDLVTNVRYHRSKAYERQLQLLR